MLLICDNYNYSLKQKRAQLKHKWNFSFFSGMKILYDNLIQKRVCKVCLCVSLSFIQDISYKFYLLLTYCVWGLICVLNVVCVYVGKLFELRWDGNSEVNTNTNLYSLFLIRRQHYTGYIFSFDWIEYSYNKTSTNPMH